MRVVLYRDDSAPSLEVVAFLQEHGVVFENVDVRTDAGFDRLLKRTRGKNMPVIELKKAHSIMIIEGLNKELLIRGME